MGRKRNQIDFALRFWRLTHWAKRLGHITPFRQMAGLIASERAFRASFLPVGECIDVPPGIAAPREVIVDYIERACHKTILRVCPCREGEGCERHPRDLGCIFLGSAARDVDPGVGYEATVEEAIAHVDRALASGLLPLIGHFRVDQVVFGVGDFSRFLTVCFCCSCCCIVRSGMKNLVRVYPNSLVRLEGVEVRVSEECVGCGGCVTVCPVENITIEEGAAVMGSVCLGCGACAEACDRGLIEMTLSPGAPVYEELRARIEDGVDIT